MTISLCFPMDEVTGNRPDFDRAADFLELSAFFASDCETLISDIANQITVGANEDYVNLDEETRNGAEEIISGVVRRIGDRRHALDAVYPFELDDDGSILTYVPQEESLGRTAYILSLVLSNLKAISPILSSSSVHPEQTEITTLREYFQYFATAALAAEIQGRSWSFGFPRPDRSGFINKLNEIWRILGDGNVETQVGASQHPKDDQIDVFAARLQRDKLPGFLLAVAQVATGQDAQNKSLKGHINVFKSRWFSRQPVTEFVPYMIVPFARRKDEFIDDVRVMGNVLHRLRVPRLVEKAKQFVVAGVTVEGYERLTRAAQWIENYRSRAEQMT